VRWQYFLPLVAFIKFWAYFRHKRKLIPCSRKFARCFPPLSASSSTGFFPLVSDVFSSQALFQATGFFLVCLRWMQRGKWGNLCIYVATHLFSRLLESMFPFSTPSSCAMVCQRRSCYVGLQHAVSLWLTPWVSSCLGAHVGGLSTALCSEGVEKLWKSYVMWPGTRGMTAKAHTGRGSNIGHLGKSHPGDWLHLLLNRSSSLLCFHMLPKACPESSIIYYCSYHIVFVLGQELKMLTAVCEIHRRTVSGSLYPVTSVLHRFR